MKTYRNHPPNQEETSDQYARRLELQGAEEMLIRKALADHYDMPISEMAEFFEGYEDARLRHLDLLWKMHPSAIGVRPGAPGCITMGSHAT